MPAIACAVPVLAPARAPRPLRRRLFLLLASTATVSLLSTPLRADPPISANGVNLGVLTNVIVNALPGERAVIAYNPGGMVTLDGGVINVQSTIAQRGLGLLGRSDGVINSSADVTTTGDRGHAVQAGNSGPNVTLYDGSTAGTVNLTGGQISTNGVYSLGLHAVDRGVINASNVIISTTGATSFGGQAESASTINLVNASVTTSGAGATGLVANNDMVKDFNIPTPGGVINAQNTAITTSGLAAGGVLASHGAVVSLENGSVTTSGDQSVGLSALIDGQITSNANITTGGVGAHAAQAGGAGAADPLAAYDGATAGVVTLTGGLLRTSGQGAMGLHATDAGVIHATAVDIATTGLDATGAYADSNSAISLTSAMISVAGEGAHALLASNGRLPVDATATGGVINATDVTIVAQGTGGHGVVAENGASITLSGGSVTVSGDYAAGLMAISGGRITGNAAIAAHGGQGIGALAGDNGSITLTGGSVSVTAHMGQGLLAVMGGTVNSAADVTTLGHGSHAVQAGFAEATDALYAGATAGAVTLTGGAISTAGILAAGLYATDGGQINAGPVAVTTTGDGGHGALAQTGSRIDLDGASFHTSGVAALGLLASNDRRRAGVDAAAPGGVIRGSASVQTTGTDAHGVVADFGGQVELTAGSVNTSGAGARGVLAHSGGTIESAANISVTGVGAHAVQAGFPEITAPVHDGSTAGVVRLAGGAVSATGAMASGLYAVDGGRIIASGAVAVTTGGDGGHGAMAQTSGRIELDGTSFATSGVAAHGLVAGNDRRRDGIDDDAPGGVIQGRAHVQTTGADAHAAVAEHGGRLELTGGALAATGSGAAGLVVRDGGVVVADMVSIASAQDAAIRTHNNAAITLNGAGTITGASAAIATTFDKADQHVALLIGPGVHLASDSNVLLAVDRSGAGGDSGVVALGLGSGSVATGDILDTDAKTTGFTDVELAEKASWSGVAKGVRHIRALHGGGELHVRDGSAIAGDIAASETVLRFGEGGVQVDGGVTLTSSRTSGGSLANPVQVGGDVLVDSGSIFGGNWRIGGDLVNHGVIAPGNSIGVVQVNGNLNLGPSSVYQVDINAGGQSDLIEVAGQAHLGGRVVVAPGPGGNGYVVGARQVIVTAAGGVGGTTFDGGASWAPGQSYVFLTPILGYDANNAYLTVVRNSTPMEETAKTPNQAAAAAAVDRLPADNSLFSIIANLPTADAAAQAFGAISGDVHASIAGALVSQSHHVRDAVTGRIRQSFADGDGADDNSDVRQVRRLQGLNATLWGQAFGGWGHAGGGGAGVARTSQSLAGFLAGVDAQAFDNWRLGVAGGYSRGAFDINNRASSSGADSYHVALYGGGQYAGLGMRWGAAYTWNDATVSRTIAFPGFADSARGAWRSGIAQVFGEIGQEFRQGATTIEPFLGLAWVGYDGERFRENGGVAALSGKTGRMSTTYSTFGGRLAHTFTLANGAGLTARATVGWIHAFGDVDPRGRMWLAGAATPFTVAGAPIARDSLLLEAGLDMSVAANVTLGATWSAQLAQHGQEQSLKGNFAIRF